MSIHPCSCPCGHRRTLTNRVKSSIQERMEKRKTKKKGKRIDILATQVDGPFESGLPEYWKFDPKAAALSDTRFDADPPIHSLNSPFHDGQSNAGTRVDLRGVQSLQYIEYFLM